MREKEGIGCGSVGRVVSSNTRGPQFESSYWQMVIFTVNYRKDENKDKRCPERRKRKRVNQMRRSERERERERKRKGYTHKVGQTRKLNYVQRGGQVRGGEVIKAKTEKGTHGRK